MVLELCSGSLFQVIQNTYDGPALPSDREVMYQIADGLNYVHSQNLVHLDIKPENILISTNGQMKLADFGLCMENKRGVCILNGSVRGTYSWMAPEVFPRDGSNMNKVSAMADVFSCGCVFFVFLSREDGGIHPFGDRNSHHETIQNNIREGNQVNMEGKFKLFKLCQRLQILLGN
jgi:serine/threonine protein kinase